MHAFKGFITHSNFSNNAIGVVAPFGEISTQSLSYAKEKGLYALDAAPKLSYISFLSRRDATDIVVPQAMSDHILTISQFVYDVTAGTGGAIGSNELLNRLVAQFQDVASNFACGQMVTDGRFYVPQWVSWKNTSVAEVPDNTVRVWFADSAFREQYDEYSIVVIPPIVPLDDFFKAAVDVAELLNATTIPEMTSKLQISKDVFPETFIRVEGYNYVDPFNAANKTMSYWGLVIYGIAGNNVDTISDTLVDYILANSTHTREEWQQILPDLFRRTEFMIFPQWWNYAIENRQLTEGIYSPVVNLAEMLYMIKQSVPSYPASHINDVLDIMGHPYKCLPLATIGGPDNRDGKVRLVQHFPDLLSVASTSIDFNRMTQETQGFLLMLLELLLMAETMNEFTTMPITSFMTKTVRNNVLFVVKRYRNVNYFVAAKVNYNASQVPT